MLEPFSNLRLVVPVQAVGLGDELLLLKMFENPSPPSSKPRQEYKLERLSLAIIFYYFTIRMNLSQAGSYSSKQLLLALPVNIKLGLKILPCTIALAYFAKESATVKKFM
jgi:hypothetical protein